MSLDEFVRDWAGLIVAAGAAQPAIFWQAGRGSEDTLHTKFGFAPPPSILAFFIVIVGYFDSSTSMLFSFSHQVRSFPLPQ